jgi:hypothetical protein
MELIYWQQAAINRDAMRLNSLMLREDGWKSACTVAGKGRETKRMEVLFDRDYVVYRLAKLFNELYTDETSLREILEEAINKHKQDVKSCPLP